MATNCSACGAKLFGAETSAGMCEYCERDPNARKPGRGGSGPGTEGNTSKTAAGYELARGGVRIFFIGQILLGLATLSLLALKLWQLYQDLNTVREWQPIIETATSIVGMLVVSVNLIGMLLCCLVPEAAGLRVRAVYTAALILLSVGLGVVVWLTATGRLDLRTELALRRKIEVIFLTSVVMAYLTFFQLLGGLAEARKAEGLSWRLKFWPFLVPGVLFYLVLGTMVVVSLFDASQVVAERAPYWVGGITALLLWVRMLALFWQLSESMTDRA
jgi:hypothetical protein